MGDARTTKFDILHAYRSERMLAERMSARLGLRPELRGSMFIVDAATLYAYTDMPINRIYATVAEYHGITPSGVHKNAAYAVDRSVRLSYSISIMFDVPLDKSDLHPNTVIAYVAMAIKRPELTDAICDRGSD